MKAESCKSAEGQLCAWKNVSMCVCEKMSEKNVWAVPTPSTANSCLQLSFTLAIGEVYK